MIRPARLSDLSGILNLYQELRPNDPRLEATQAKQKLDDIISNPNTEIIVADIEGKLCATCMLGVVPSLAMGAKPFGIIEHVVTLSEARGKGYGKAVLTYALELAWKLGCYKVVLLSGAQRTDAHHLYKSVGFVGDVEKGFVAKPKKN